jgi:hypothetical protein
MRSRVFFDSTNRSNRRRYLVAGSGCAASTVAGVFQTVLPMREIPLHFRCICSGANFGAQPAIGLALRGWGGGRGAFPMRSRGVIVLSQIPIASVRAPRHHPIQINRSHPPRIAMPRRDRPLG